MGAEDPAEGPETAEDGADGAEAARREVSAISLVFNWPGLIHLQLE